MGKHILDAHIGAIHSGGQLFLGQITDFYHKLTNSNEHSGKKNRQRIKGSALLKGIILGLLGFAALGMGLHMAATPSSASGFALFTTGATELAQCDSVIAHTEGPASNFYNPALLPALSGTQIEMGTIMLKPAIDFKSDLTGQKTSSRSNYFFPSSLLISHKIDDRFSVGLGVYSTFGLGNEWPDDWEGKYIVTYSKLKTYNINPNLAWKVSNSFTLAWGLDILLGDITLEQKVSLPPDAKQKIKGEGDGYGYNLGMLYKVSEDLVFGMSYRSGITLEIEGDYSLAIAGLKTGVKTDLDLPAQIFAGISYKPSENILLEIGGKWEEWSSYKDLKLKANLPIFLGSDTITMPKDWKNVFGFNIGIKYNIDSTLSISAGYLHEGNPVPSDTFEPSVPVSDRNDYSVGIQKTFNKYKIGLSYLYDRYDSRHKNNNVGSGSANGKYEQDIHMIGLSISYIL